jgi:hypothetical protein
MTTPKKGALGILKESNTPKIMPIIQTIYSTVQSAKYVTPLLANNIFFTA